MRKLKIAHITPYYFPSIGGVENAVKDLAEGMVERGHEVTVMTAARNHRGQPRIPSPRQEVINGVHVHRFPPMLSCGQMSLFPGVFRTLWNQSFDILHLHAVRHPHTLIGPLVARAKSMTPILHGHSHFFDTAVSPTKQFLYETFDRMAFENFYDRLASVITLTKFEKKQFILRGVSERKICVVPYAVSDIYFKPVDSETFLQKHQLRGRPFILFLGHFHRHKRVDLLVRALPELTRKHRNLMLVLAGPDHDTFPRLSALAAQLGVQERLKWVGPLTDHEKRQAMAAMEFLVLPSAYEAFGLVLIEAMAVGKPVVAAKSPGPLEIIRHGITGFLFDRGSIPQLVKACDTLLRHWFLIDEMGVRARRAVKYRYSLNQVLDQVEELYFELLERNVKVAA